MHDSQFLKDLSSYYQGSQLSAKKIKEMRNHLLKPSGFCGTLISEKIMQGYKLSPKARNGEIRKGYSDYEKNIEALFKFTHEHAADLFSQVLRPMGRLCLKHRTVDQNFKFLSLVLRYAPKYTTKILQSTYTFDNYIPYTGISSYQCVSFFHNIIRKGPFRLIEVITNDDPTLLPALLTLRNSNKKTIGQLCIERKTLDHFFKLLEIVKQHAPWMLEKILLASDGRGETVGNLFIKRCNDDELFRLFNLIKDTIPKKFTQVVDANNRFARSNICQTCAHEKDPLTLLNLLNFILEHAPQSISSALPGASKRRADVIDIVLKKDASSKKLFIKNLKNHEYQKVWDTLFASPYHVAKLSPYLPKQTHLALLGYLAGKNTEALLELFKSGFRLNTDVFMSELHKKQLSESQLENYRFEFEELYNLYVITDDVYQTVVAIIEQAVPFTETGPLKPGVDIDIIPADKRRGVVHCCDVILNALGTPQSDAERKERHKFFAKPGADNVLIKKVESLLSVKSPLFLPLLKLTIENKTVYEAIHHLYSWRRLDEAPQQFCHDLLVHAYLSKPFDLQILNSLMKGTACDFNAISNQL